MPEGHIRIPDWLCEREDVSAHAKVLWGLLRRLQGDDAIAYPRYDTIGRMIGMSRRNVLRYITELEDRWLLEIRLTRPHRDGNGYVYRANAFICHDGSERFRTRAEQRTSWRKVA